MNRFLKAINIAACLSLFGLVGSFYATGVFSSAIDEASKSHIKGKWASSMSLMIFLVTPSMIGTAFYLESGEASRKSFRVKSLTAASSFFFCGFTIAGNGVHFNSSWLILLGVSLLGVPLGVFYLLCTELLSAWMPDHAGLAVGLGQAAFGLGTIIFSGLFGSLVHWYGTDRGIWLSGFVLGIPVLFATFLLSWPQSQVCDEECGYQEIGQAEKISLSVLCRSRSFWLYIAISFCSQTGFAMVPFFFDMGTSFGPRLESVILLFQISNTAGTLARLFSGILTDFLSSYTQQNGAKTLMAALLALQTVSFVSLGLATNYKGTFWIFVLGSIVLFITFSGGACVVAVLARELFGARNSGTVYGFGGGLAIGCGESSASFLVGRLLSATIASDVSVQYKFRGSFYILGITSLLGLICCKIVTKSKEAFSLR